MKNVTKEDAQGLAYTVNVHCSFGHADQYIFQTGGDSLSLKGCKYASSLLSTGPNTAV